ncbi:hypothetical protein M8J77_011779 [Diaphorina citri]|nr:hypothetical protein M8J77_011779 [Diaphorina citri]
MNGLFFPGEDKPEIQDDEDSEERAALIEELRNILRNRRRIKRRNDLLKRCLKEFFKKRKMDHVFKEQETSSAEIEAAYENKLNNYHKVKQANLAEIQSKQELEDVLEREKSRMEQAWTQLFQTLRQTELGLVTALVIGGKLGKKDNMIKKFSKLLDSQSVSYEKEGEARSAEIKLREQIRSSEAKLKLMDNIGDQNVQIYDYERVQAENARIQTKIDDKIAELRRIEDNNRNYRSNISELKHKISTLKARTDTLSTNLQYLRETLETTSKCFNKSVRTRNSHLHQVSLLTDSCELNLHPHLLKDYQDKTIRLEHLDTQIQHIKQTIHQVRSKTDALKPISPVITGINPVKIDLDDRSDGLRLNRFKLNHWSRSKSRSSEDSSTIQSNLSNLTVSFNTRKLELLTSAEFS